MTRRTAPARKIKTAAEIAAEQSSRLAHLSAGGEHDFVVVVRFLGETSPARMFRTMKIKASAERADHVAQMSVMQLGPRATVAMVYGAAGAGALGC